MKRYITVLVPILLLTFSSCEYFSKKVEKNFCDKIYAINDSLDKLNNDWLAAVNFSIKKKEYSTLNAKRIFIGQFIGRNRIVVAEADATKNMDGFRIAERNFLTAQAEVVSDIYTPFEMYNEFTPKATLDRCYNAVIDSINSGRNASARIVADLKQFEIAHKLGKSSKKQ